MNVHCNQQGLLNPCPERLVHRPFGAGLTFLPRTKTASPQPCKHTVCRVDTKLPADQVKQHPGAVTQLHPRIVVSNALRCTSSQTDSLPGVAQFFLGQGLPIWPAPWHQKAPPRWLYCQDLGTARLIIQHPLAFSKIL